MIKSFDAMNHELRGGTPFSLQNDKHMKMLDKTVHLIKGTVLGWRQPIQAKEESNYKSKLA
jgi:hypothetical protein